MTDENKNLEEIKEEKNEVKKSSCLSEEFKKFIIVATGSFVGVFFALCLFTALHRPPMHPIPIRIVPIHQQMYHFDRRPMPHHLKGEPRHHEMHKIHKHFGPEDVKKIEHRKADRVHPPKPID